MPEHAVDWDACRKHFPVFNEWAYFSWASVAALSTPVVDAIQEQVARTRDQGVSVYREWYVRFEAARMEAAKLIGADFKEIAFIKNTTEGVNTVAAGMPFDRGDNVIVPRREFPSNAYPWLALKEKGVEVRRVETNANGAYAPADVMARIDDRTRVVAVSFVNFATGFQSDLKRIGRACRERGILFFVDAIQGLGVLPLNVEDMAIDALAADGHKWICGPEGLGILFIRKDLQDRIRPLSRGWWSAALPGRYDLDDQELCRSARRYECGTLTTSAIYGLHAALCLINEIGVERIAERISCLTDGLIKRLTALDYSVLGCDRKKPGSGIVSFDPKGLNAGDLARDLERKKIMVNPRDGRLRAAVHAWNNEEDLDRLMEALCSSS